MGLTVKLEMETEKKKCKNTRGAAAPGGMEDSGINGIAAARRNVFLDHVQLNARGWRPQNSVG